MYYIVEMFLHPDYKVVVIVDLSLPNRRWIFVLFKRFNLKQKKWEFEADFLVVSLRRSAGVRWWLQLVVSVKHLKRYVCQGICFKDSQNICLRLQTF